jgi:hypothetical protein
MMRLTLTGLAVLLAALVLVADAAAKGASEAEITGPGLANPISLAGEGQAGGGALTNLAQDAGFFPAVFPQIPDPMLSEQPRGDLGPRYTITYVMPGPNGVSDRIVQDVYPYATPSPVTYVKPGQSFFEGQQTRGGWYVATVLLKDDLVTTGLPETPPAGGGDSSFPWTTAGLLATVALVLGLAAGAVVLLRRRPGAAPA